MTVALINSSNNVLYRQFQHKATSEQLVAGIGGFGVYAEAHSGEWEWEWERGVRRSKHHDTHSEMGSDLMLLAQRYVC